MKKKICKCITKNLVNINEEELMKLIEIPPDQRLGDFALPCFSFAKIMHKNPKVIAEDVKEALQGEKQDLGIEKKEVVNGYLNIFMNRAIYVKYWIDKFTKGDFEMVKIGIGTK